MRTVIRTSASVLNALKLLVPGASTRTLRQMLSQGRVCLNGRICKLGQHQARSGDVIEIGAAMPEPKLLHGIQLLYEDSYLIVIHKPAGLLSVATAHENAKTAYAYLRNYVRQRDSRQRLFIVHRLDKFVSGLLVFAKSEATKAKLQALFQKHDIQRKYWAIVEGSVTQNQGTIRSYLAEDRSLRMRSTPNRGSGKQAITHYRILRRLSNLTVMEITLETGRKNQIRAHLSEMGHPIVGDRAYGSTIDPLGRFGLHAFCLGFVHPAWGKPLLFTTDPPGEFLRYIKIEKKAD
jgi:23S rRNA pseudouridine1911/1915/1917 synthase